MDYIIHVPCVTWIFDGITLSHAFFLRDFLRCFLCAHINVLFRESEYLKRGLIQ